MKSAIILLLGVVAVSRGEIETPESLKLTVPDGTKQLDVNKDLELSASDRSFLIGRDYGYGGGYGNGYGYGNNLGGGYGYNRGSYTPNSVYRGYNSGLSGILGGSSLGYGSYGSGYGTNYGTNYGGYGYSPYSNGYGGYGSSYGGYGGLDGGYGGYGGYSGSGGYGGLGNGYNNNGYGSRGYGAYNPSGYRGYS